MLTSSKPKQGRWVYERGGLELDSKNLIGYYSVFRHCCVLLLRIAQGVIHYSELDNS
jgi:hypothetical protein